MCFSSGQFDPFMPKMLASTTDNYSYNCFLDRGVSTIGALHKPIILSRVSQTIVVKCRDFSNNYEHIPGGSHSSAWSSQHWLIARNS